MALCYSYLLGTTVPTRIVDDQRVVLANLSIGVSPGWMIQQSRSTVSHRHCSIAIGYIHGSFNRWNGVHTQVSSKWWAKLNLGCLLFRIENACVLVSLSSFLFNVPFIFFSAYLLHCM